MRIYLGPQQGNHLPILLLRGEEGCDEEEEGDVEGKEGDEEEGGYDDEGNESDGGSEQYDEGSVS